MRKKIITAYLLTLVLNNMSAQATDPFNKSMDNINKIFPAAPTANNLMKFEEVPVSYYTGIPDISIPLFNIPTNSSDVNLDISLRYHPLSAKPDDRASETGLGWNLMAGGTITRTVRGGVPDEKIESTLMSSPPKPKYGIYRHELNNTYEIIYNLMSNWSSQEYAFYTGIGKFDTEYDLYQYNFMGYTGRFIIKKDPSGNYVVEKLDRNNLKITVTQDSYGEVQTATITDDKGIQYIFRGMENASKDISTVKVGLVNNTGDLLTNTGGGLYFTAYHLEEVKDENNKPLMTFTYDQASVVKYKDPEIRTSRLARDINYHYNNGGGMAPNPDPHIPGALEVQNVYNTAYTKLLTGITIADRAKIKFNYEKGRNDSNYMNAADLYKLKSVESLILDQVFYQPVDKFTFDYEYSNSTILSDPNPPETLKKLLLKKVTKEGQSGKHTHTIAYHSSVGPFKKDPWGYYKGNITQDVISSIIYPTKGKVAFDFGENDYSYFAGYSKPIDTVTGHWVDTENEYSFNDLTAFDPNVKSEFFTVTVPQQVQLHLDLGSLIYSQWKFKIYKKTGHNTFSPALIEFGADWQECESTGGAACANQNLGSDGNPITQWTSPLLDLEAGATYYVSLEGNYGITQKPISYVLSVRLKQHYFNSYTVKNGGGLRVNGIKYFDTPVANTPAKQYIYDYKDLDNPGKSSGALVFPEPVFAYEDRIIYAYQNENTGAFVEYNCKISTTTNQNIIPNEKSQGSDVGYKYVTVKQIAEGPNNSTINNGSTVYKFRSPIDFPNPEMISLEMPIVPITNHDYLRGQVISEKKYNSEEKIISEINHEYATLTSQKLEGVKIRDNYYNVIHPVQYQWDDYNTFKSKFPDLILTTPYLYYTTYGIVLPGKKTETSYFYKNGVQNSVTDKTETSYTTNDYPSVVTQQHPDGTSTRTSYKYATEKQIPHLITANMISIPLEEETIEKQNSNDPGKRTAKTEITYNHPAGLFPDQVKSLNTITGGMETKIKYDRYDEKGNLMQYTVKDGTPVTIIWGYNKSLPIAKIEGVKLSEISQSIIDTVVQASDQDALAGLWNTEWEFALALEQFRNDPVFDEAQITTYTYDPLVGVRSITLPSGLREYYTYDEEKRLKEITKEERDGTGQPFTRTVKEFQYNLKN